MSAPRGVDEALSLLPGSTHYLDDIARP